MRAAVAAPTEARSSSRLAPRTPLDDPTVLTSMPFEPIPLGEVNKQAPVWPQRDPDFQPAPAYSP